MHARRTMMLAGVAASLVCGSSALAGDSVFFDFFLGGDQEVPANTSDSFGFATLEYSPLAQSFDLFLVTDGIALGDLLGVGPNSTPIHIHSANAGSNGPIVIDLGLLGSFEDEGGGILSFNVFDIPIGANEAALFNEGLYLNVHTSDFPGGEIRGQIVPAPGGFALAGLGGIALVRRRRPVA